MRQENFNSGYDISQEREQQGFEREERGVLRCENCDIDILWPPVIVEGVAYCCTGCAAGGPCCCDYSQYRSVTISGVIHYGSDEEVTKEASDKEN